MDPLIYEQPLLYEIAFSYRDFAAEADALERWLGRRPARFLELAAGPADLALEMARRGIASTALDRAPAMCAYARAKAEMLGLALEVVEGDLIAPRLAGRFDAAALLNASLAHVETEAALAAHLRALEPLLADDGCYAIEVVPRLGRAEALRPWTVERYGIEVETRWGRADDRWDPERRILRVQVEMRVRSGGAERYLTEVMPMREWTAEEVLAVVERSPFVLERAFAELRPEAPAIEPEGRCVLLLRRR